MTKRAASNSSPTPCGGFARAFCKPSASKAASCACRSTKSDCKLSRASTEFEQKFQRRPSAEELAELLDTDLDRIKDSLNAGGKKVSVDAPFQDDETNSMIDVMTDDSAPGTDNSMERESLATDIDTALQVLSERERLVVKMLFGIGRTEMTAEEVATNLGLTRERVRQIKERALRRLREEANMSILIKYLG